MSALVGDDEGDEPRDDSEAALHTDLSEALHTGSENDDDQDEDDEPRLTAEAMESMTVSSVMLLERGLLFFPRRLYSCHFPHVLYRLSLTSLTLSGLDFNFCTKFSV